jgi:hypothetical protein
MSIYIQKFIDRISGLEARGSKDYMMPMADAKGLYSDITNLLLQLNNLRENQQKAPDNEIIEVKIDGGSY